MSKEKHDVALVSLLSSFIMIILKASVWFGTGSLSVISETAHSSMDFFATLLTYWAVRESGKPADEHHHYGHEKVESVSAFVQTILLFLIAVMIVKEAAERLFLNENHHVIANGYAFIVFSVCILIDFWRYKKLSSVGAKTCSHALQADALHFGSDMLGSVAVIFGFIGTALGWAKADLIAAIAVAMLIFSAGYQLAKNVVSTLIDTAPEGIVENIEELLRKIPHVKGIGRICVRTTGANLLIDCSIYADSKISFQQSNEILEEAVRVIKLSFCNAEPFISVVPYNKNRVDKTG